MKATPTRPPIFYGWWIVTAAFFISLYTAGVIHFGFTAIFEPIAKEFGWSYAQISLAASLRGLETGLLAPLVGILVDRWGSRKMAVIGAAVAGLGVVVLSQIDSLAMFYVAFVLIAIGTSASSATVFLAAVAQWFRRRMAIAAGIMSCGFALGGLVVPLITMLIERYGWRDSMLVLGIGVWVVAVPLSLFIRHKPEEYGYLPDGDRVAVAGSGGGPDISYRSMEPEIDISGRQALRSRAFWHIALAFMFQILVLNAVTVHVMPYLSSIGMSRSASSFVATAIPMASILGRLGFGWSGDRLNRKKIAAASFVLIGLGLVMFGIAAGGARWVLLPVILLLGIGWGGGVTMRVALLREYFGRNSFGSIHGFTLGVTMVGNVVGAPAAGFAFDKWGSYGATWFVFAALAAASVVLIMTTPAVSRRVVPVPVPTRCDESIP